MKRLSFFSLIIFASAVSPLEAICFPQYADWISKTSGRQIDCSYCHVNSAGPLGKGPGQEGIFTPAQLSKMHTADSPVLNDFGLSIIRHEGLERFTSNTTSPEKTAQDLKAYDLDGDGISDGVEMENGTLADDPLSAPPWLVWPVRLKRHLRFVLLMMAGAVIGALGLFKLSQTVKD